MLAYTFEVVRVVANGDDTAVSASEIEQWIDFDDDPRRRPQRPPQSDFSDFYVYSQVEFACREVRGDGCGHGRGHWRRR